MPAIITNPMKFIGRLLIWRAVLYVAGVLTSATLGALSGMQWNQADAQTKFMVIIGIFGTVAGTVGAYLDQSAAKLSKGELPFVDIPNETQTTTATVQTEKTVTVTAQTT